MSKLTFMRKISLAVRVLKSSRLGEFSDDNTSRMWCIKDYIWGTWVYLGLNRHLKDPCASPHILEDRISVEDVQCVNCTYPTAPQILHHRSLAVGQWIWNHNRFYSQLYAIIWNCILGGNGLARRTLAVVTWKEIKYIPRRPIYHLLNRPLRHAGLGVYYYQDPSRLPFY